MIITTYMQNESSRKKRETLAITDLFIIYGVGLADLVERLLAQTPCLTEVVMCGKGAVDVAKDGLLAWGVLYKNRQI